MYLSVVIPTFNEQDNINNLHNRLSNTLKKLGKKYEIIFVDDGSKDRTFRILSNINKSYKHVKVIKFRRNFGQTAAIFAGFRHSRGEIIITMDADLQNYPEDIPLLLEKIKEGYDVVSGWRYKRKDKLFTKNVPSFFSNWLVRRFFKIDIHDSGCTLKAYKRGVISGLAIYGETHRYIPAIVASKGFKVTEVKVRHKQRVAGKGKYGTTRLMKGLLDLAYIKFWSSYSTRPLHFFGFLGLLQYLIGALIFIEQIIKALIIKSLDVGPLFIVSVLLAITGTLFIIFGFLSEILIRVYYTNIENASYIIEKILK